MLLAGVNAEKLAGAVERADQAAAELRGHGRSLDFLGSILVPADEIVFWLFDGQEADVRGQREGGRPVRTDPRGAPHRRQRADEGGEMRFLPRKAAALFAVAGRSW